MAQPRRPVDTVSPVPNQPKANTSTHTFRCPDDLWKAAMAAAPEVGTTVPLELNKALKNLVKRAERKKASDQ